MSDAVFLLALSLVLAAPKGSALLVPRKALPATAQPIATESSSRTGSVGSIRAELSEACDQEDDASCRALRPLLRSACQAGDAKGCHALAMLLIWGKGGPQAHEAARTFEERSCALSLYESCRVAGLMLLSSRSQAERSRGRSLVNKACQKGIAEACYVMGVAYETGDGMDSDVTRAVGFYVQGCSSGSAEACYRLALLYRDGRGVPQDASKADVLLAQACQSGVSNACDAKESGSR